MGCFQLWFSVGAETRSAILLDVTSVSVFYPLVTFVFILYFMVSIYLSLLFWPCGFRTTGEALFCNSPKEYPEKTATTTTPL